MKKFLIKSSIAGLSLLAFSTAHSQSATSAAVKFTGFISNTTCVVNVNDRNKNVVFGTVPGNASGFRNGGANIGDVALPAFERPLEITLENCSPPNQNNQPGNVVVRITGQDVLPSGRLQTTNSSINIQLLEHNSPTPWTSDASLTIPLLTGQNILKFKARYYVAAALATGQADSNAIFNMEYQ